MLFLGRKFTGVRFLEQEILEQEIYGREIFGAGDFEQEILGAGDLGVFPLECFVNLCWSHQCCNKKRDNRRLSLLCIIW